MAEGEFPNLYEVNTRPWLYRLGQSLGLAGLATFDDVSEAALDQWAAQGFDWLYLMGVWQTGEASQRVSAAEAQWRQEYVAELPDFSEADVCGSPFAVRGYSVHSDFGGAAVLARLRQRLQSRGIKLMLDFVPNHSALDHPWALSHPEFYVHGSEADLAAQPQNYVRVDGPQGSPVLAHGKDPYFDGWTDTLQHNYRQAGLRAAQQAELLGVAEQCDGVRCDMAMLLLPDIFLRTWAERSQPADGTPPVDVPWWPEAIGRVKERRQDFVFMAEVYWDLEWNLQRQGFDYTYDKRLYDRLRDVDTAEVRAHLGAGLDFQRKLVRFLENHDEPRAAGVFPFGQNQAAAILTYLAPGLRFFHEGQFEGLRVKTSLHLRRWPAEASDPLLDVFYRHLLELLKRTDLRAGDWQLLGCHPAWDGNPTWEQFVAFRWQGEAGQRLLVCVNYGPSQGQCYVAPASSELQGLHVCLRDLLGPEVYTRDGSDLAERGLYLDRPPWGYNVFELTT
jgi:Alpha amylase, catalytic domain